MTHVNWNPLQPLACYPRFPVACLSDVKQYPYRLSKLQIVSVLLNESDASSASSLAIADAGFAGKTDTLALLGRLANAVAIGNEAGEDIDEISVGSIELQVTVKLVPNWRWLVGNPAGHLSMPFHWSAMPLWAFSILWLGGCALQGIKKKSGRARTKRCCLLPPGVRSRLKINFVFPTHHHQAAKVAESSVPEALVTVGDKGVLVSFEDWVVPVGVEDNSAIVTAVATLGVSVSQGTISYEQALKESTEPGPMQYVLPCTTTTWFSRTATHIHAESGP